MHKQLDLLSKGSLHEKPMWIKLFKMHKTQQKKSYGNKQNKIGIKLELQTQNAMVSWRWFGPGELTAITHGHEASWLSSTEVLFEMLLVMLRH